MEEIKIAGEMQVVTVEGKLADATIIKDSSRGNKSQKEINDELQGEIHNNTLAIEIDPQTGDIIATTGTDSVYRDISVDPITGEIIVNAEY